MYRILSCFVVALLIMSTSCAQVNNELYLFVGTYAKDTESGIYLYRFNTVDGSASLVKEVSGIENPSYLAVSHDEKFLYSVCETGERKAGVYVYSFDKKTECIDLINNKLTKGGAPCFVWTDKKQKIVVTANYSGGSISAFPLSETGRLGELSLFSFEGGTLSSARQNSPHLHCIFASPDEKYLYANDLGADRIYKFDIIYDANNDAILKEGQPTYFSLPAGEGPRHTTFHQNGKFAYQISELSGNVTVMRYANGDLTPVQFIEADTLHAGGSADIHITPDGRFLYVSNRLKGDGLAIFSIDSYSGLLTKVGYQPTESHPRNFIITPDGKFLLCACRDGQVIMVFEIDKQNGSLKNINKNIKVKNPVCLKFSSM